MKICVVLLAALGLSGCASRQLHVDHSLSGETSLVGCLRAGPEPGQYFLMDREDKEMRTLVTGDPELANHTDHAVRVIGMLNRELPVEGMKAIRIEHIAMSCHTPF